MGGQFSPEVQVLTQAMESRAMAAMQAAAQPGLVSRALDGLVSMVSPRWGTARQLSRMESAMAVYQAAEVNRMTADWLAQTVTGDQAVLGDLHTMNARARQSRRDDWSVASICDSFRRDVGYLTPRAAAFDPSKPTWPKLVAFNKRLDWKWRRWSRSKMLCDLAKRQTVAEMCGTLVEERVQVGNGFIVPGFQERGGPVPLVLELFEVEQLAHDLFQSPEGREIRGGVEIDEHGAPVNYWFYRGEHPLESASSRAVAVPVDRVLHFGRPTRVRETLAATPLSPVLMDARSLKQYLTYEDRAKQIEACVALQLTRDTNAKRNAGAIGMGAKKPGEAETLTDGAGRPIRQMQSGTIYDCPPGTKLETLNTARPGGQFQAYTDKRLGAIAAGAGRSRSSVSREYTSSYTAERRGEVEDHKGNRLDHELLRDTVLQPIRELFINMAIVTGALEVPDPSFLTDPEKRAALYETEWMPPRREPLDPSRDAAAKKLRLDYKLDNRGTILNEENRDWRDNFDDIEEQSAYAEERGIVLPEAGGAGPTSPNESRPRGKSNAPDGTADDADDKGGDTEEGDDESRGYPAADRGLVHA